MSKTHSKHITSFKNNVASRRGFLLLALYNPDKMKTYIKILCALLLAIGTSLTGHAQDQSIVPIEVGGMLPDLTFTNVTNTNEKQIRLSDYKGKVIILDFWATWCGPCIGTMPKIDSLQLKFKDDLKVIMVGDEDKKIIDEFFRNKEKQKKMKFVAPSIYNDQTLSKYFPHKFIPHSIIINKEGKVAAITSASDINEATITEVIKTGKTNVYAKSDRFGVDREEVFFNERYERPLQVTEGEYGPKKLRFRSVITREFNDAPGTIMPWLGRLLVSSTDLAGLYTAAFSYSFEPFYETVFRNRLIIESKNKYNIIQPRVSSIDSIRRWNKDHRYIYDLYFPNDYVGPYLKKAPDSIRKYQCEVLKKDLEKFTGLDAFVAKRNVDCLVLSCIDSSLVNSKEDFGVNGDTPGMVGSVVKAHYSRYLYYRLQLAFNKNEKNRDIPLITEVAYDGPINLYIDGDFTDWEVVSKQLEKFGFRLSREKRKIDMLIIADK